MTAERTVLNDHKLLSWVFYRAFSLVLIISVVEGKRMCLNSKKPKGFCVREMSCLCLERLWETS